MNERKRQRPRRETRIAEVRARSGQELARRHELLLEASSCVGWEWEVESGSVFLEGDVARLFGISSSESVASIQEFLGLVHPEDRLMHQESLKRALVKGRGTYCSAFRIVRPDDGRVVFVEDRGSIGWGDDYSSLRVTGYLFEIR